MKTIVLAHVISLEVRNVKDFDIDDDLVITERSTDRYALGIFLTSGDEISVDGSLDDLNQLKKRIEAMIANGEKFMDV